MLAIFAIFAYSYYKKYQMKKLSFTLLLIVMTMFSVNAEAIGYTALWKQYQSARKNDLPKEMV